MCGIAGVYVRDELGRPEAGTVWDMLRAVAHRGPDDAGLAVFDGAGACRAFSPRRSFTPADASLTGRAILGHVRLSILDLSPLGHQPMASSDGRYHITYNGEVYNYLELRDELTVAGHTFKTGSDTEVILAAFAQWQEECLPRMNGMWGLAIYDREKHELFLARDRFGVKPLYYTETPWGWGFASEIKALLPLLPAAPRLNRDKLLQYFHTRGADQTENTFFAGLNQLPGGHFLRIGRAGAVKKSWYRLADHVGGGASEPTADEAVGRVREMFEDAVRLRLRSDVPVGVCLSGGLDSSAIAGMMGRLLKKAGAGPVRTFTFAAGVPGLDESAHARAVAEFVGADSRFVQARPRHLVEEMDAFVRHHDEPVSTASIFSQWEVMRLARESGVTVLLDGQGGDENFLGYNIYYATRIVRLLRSFHWHAAVTELGQAHVNMTLRRRDLLALGLYRSCPRMSRLYRRRRARRLLSAPAASEAAPLDRTRGGPNWRVDELVTSPLPHLLKYEDRNSMAFGLETRLPFLDYRLVEYVGKLPEHLLLRDGWSKWALRKAIEGLVPESVIRRRDKVGFVAPEADMLRSEGERIRKLLLEPVPTIDTVLDPARVASLAADPGRDTSETWLVLNAKLWARTFDVRA